MSGVVAVPDAVVLPQLERELAAACEHLNITWTLAPHTGEHAASDPPPTGTAAPPG